MLQYRIWYVKCLPWSNHVECDDSIVHVGIAFGTDVGSTNIASHDHLNVLEI